MPTLSTDTHVKQKWKQSYSTYYTVIITQNLLFLPPSGYCIYTVATLKRIHINSLPGKILPFCCWFILYIVFIWQNKSSLIEKCSNLCVVKYHYDFKTLVLGLNCMQVKQNCTLIEHIHHSILCVDNLI